MGGSCPSPWARTGMAARNERDLRGGGGMAQGLRQPDLRPAAGGARRPGFVLIDPGAGGGAMAAAGAGRRSSDGRAGSRAGGVGGRQRGPPRGRPFAGQGGGAAGGRDGTGGKGRCGRGRLCLGARRGVPVGQPRGPVRRPVPGGLRAGGDAFLGAEQFQPADQRDRELRPRPLAALALLLWSKPGSRPRYPPQPDGGTRCR